MAEPFPTDTSETLTTTPTLVIVGDLPSQPTTKSNPTYTATPIPTPTDLPSPTPNRTPTGTPSPVPSPTPTFTPSPTPTSILLSPLLKDITVFYTYVTYKYPGGKGMDQDQVESTAEVWRIRGDGSGKQKLFGERLLSNWMVDTHTLSLSGDGQSLVFVQAYNKWRARSGSSSLWVMGIDGSNARELIGRSDVKPGSPDWSKENETAFNAKESPVFPAWSPNGSLIAFVDPVAQGEPGRVNILDVESDRRWDVNEGEVFAWSPDGTMLALYSRIHSAVVRDLQIVNVNGETVSIIALPSSLWLRSLDWSAATGLIAAQSVELGEPVEFILVVDPLSGTSKVVVEDCYNASGSGPKWSPDGTMIAFERNVDGVDNLYVLNWDTGDERLLMPNVGAFGTWSPDSRLILVESLVQGRGLYIISVLNEQYWKIPNVGNDGEEIWYTSADWLFPSS